MQKRNCLSPLLAFPARTPGIVHPQCKSFFSLFFSSKRRLDNLRRPKLQINCFRNKFHESARAAWNQMREERKKRHGRWFVHRIQFSECNRVTRTRKKTTKKQRVEPRKKWKPLKYINHAVGHLFQSFTGRRRRHRWRSLSPLCA